MNITHDTTLIDDTQATYQKWSTELIAAMNLAGFGCHMEGHKGSSTVALSTLTVTKPGTDPEDIKYVIRFEKKLTVKRNPKAKKDEPVVIRRQICQLEVYNPKGGLHVHIRDYSSDKVAKIVEYAKATIEGKHSRKLADDARTRRADEGHVILRNNTTGFVIPDWVRVRPNIESDEDVGTFRMLFNDHYQHWPLARLPIARVKAIIDKVRELACDHKFVDSKMCLKCGWEPPPFVMPHVWREGNDPVPHELHSDAMNTKMLLLVLDGNDQPVKGWFLGGLINEFRMDGSPSTQRTLYWMPMPARPDR